jgi:hypothetical protein
VTIQSTCPQRKGTRSAALDALSREKSDFLLTEAGEEDSFGTATLSPGHWRHGVFSLA